MRIAEDRKYAQTHEWAKLDGELVRVGISDYAQQQLGDIVLVELPDPGRVVARGEAFGVIESVKAVADLCAPVSGEVIDGNAELDERPETVNQDPYEQGWIVLLRPRDPFELNSLMDASAYEQHCKEEEDA